MRIVDVRAEAQGQGRRIVARLVGEGGWDGDGELVYATEGEHAGDLEADPGVFLAAALPIAAWWGERRLVVEGAVCPRLLAGLDEIARLFAAWYPRCVRPALEATEGTRTLRPREPRRAAAFVSGGIDSSSMLKANRDAFALDHPLAIREGLFLFGLHPEDRDGERVRPERRRAWEEQRARLEAFGRAVGFNVLPVTTNLRSFHPDWAAYRDVGFGPGMIAVAHAFRARFTDLYFALHGHGVSPAPHASHPLVDHHLSSSAVQVHAGQPGWLRPEKVRAVAAWPEALAALQTCLMDGVVPEPGMANCGRCEKCVRTMLALLAEGRLAEAPTFPYDDLTPEQVEAFRVFSVRLVTFGEGLAEALAAIGRHDLVAVIEPKLAAFAAKRRRQRRRRLGRRLRGWLGLRRSEGPTMGA